MSVQHSLIWFSNRSKYSRKGCRLYSIQIQQHLVVRRNLLTKNSFSIKLDTNSTPGYTAIYEYCSNLKYSIFLFKIRMKQVIYIVYLKLGPFLNYFLEKKILLNIWIHSWPYSMALSMKLEFFIPENIFDVKAATRVYLLSCKKQAKCWIHFCFEMLLRLKISVIFGPTSPLFSTLNPYKVC